MSLGCCTCTVKDGDVKHCFCPKSDVLPNNHFYEDNLPSPSDKIDQQLKHSPISTKIIGALQIPSSVSIIITLLDCNKITLISWAEPPGQVGGLSR